MVIGPRAIIGAGSILHDCCVIDADAIIPPQSVVPPLVRLGGVPATVHAAGAAHVAWLSSRTGNGGTGDRPRETLLSILRGGWADKAIGSGKEEQGSSPRPSMSLLAPDTREMIEDEAKRRYELRLPQSQYEHTIAMFSTHEGDVGGTRD